MEWQPLDDEARTLRRREARRRIRRRRWTAGGALFAGVVGLVLALVLSGAHHTDGAAATEIVTTQAVVQNHHKIATVPARAPEPAPAASAPPGHPIPILMYHATEAPPPGTPLPRLWVPGETFAATMDALADARYHAVTMQDAYDYWKGRRRLPRQPIVLTFDDGFRSQATKALPALKRLGWRGVLYLEVGALGKPGPEGISRAEVRRMLAAGWELGAHTITHTDLTTLAPDQLRKEVAGSRSQLQHTFGVAVNSFCYPAGKYDEAVVADVERAGYLTATTVDPGIAGPGDLMTLPRIRVDGDESPETVLQAIAASGAGV